MAGFIKLNRKLMNKKFYSTDSEKVHLWIHLLFKAIYKEEGKEEYLGNKKIICQQGQFTTGRKQLSQETGISESKIERILTYFEKTEQQIEQQKTNKNRLITIINWHLYNISEQQNEQQVNNNRTTSEQQVNNNRTHYNKDNKDNKDNTVNNGNKNTSSLPEYNPNVLPENITIDEKAEKEVKSVFDFYNQQAAFIPNKIRIAPNIVEKSKQNLKTLIIDNKFNKTEFFKKLIESGLDKWNKQPDFNFWFNDISYYQKLMNDSYKQNITSKTEEDEHTKDQRRRKEWNTSSILDKYKFEEIKLHIPKINNNNEFEEIDYVNITSNLTKLSVSTEEKKQIILELLKLYPNDEVYKKWYEWTDYYFHTQKNKGCCQFKNSKYKSEGKN